MLSDRAMSRLAQAWRSPPEPSLDSLLSQPTQVGIQLDMPPLGGRFKLHGPIAGGGMGIVYRATDLETGREVAVKIPNLMGPQVDRRFELEGDALAAVVGPSVVRFVAKGTEAEPYLAMELVLGDSLGRKLTRNGPFQPADSLAMARRIASALAIAHAEGWVHRDVKPGNIAVTPEGEVRLVDFGLARAVEGAGAGTRTGDLVGTLSYLAPEQLGGDRIIDARTDVFALGCVLFETLTGIHAFKRLPSELVAGTWSMERHPELDPESVGVGPTLASMIRRLTAVDPDRRPADGLAALELLLGNDPQAANWFIESSDQRATVRDVVRRALRRPVAIIGGPGAGKTRVARAATLLLAEVLAPCRAIALRCNPRSARVAGMHALALERLLLDGGYVDAARVLRGLPPRRESAHDEPNLLILVGDAPYCDAETMERIATLTECGLARVIATAREPSLLPASFELVTVQSLEAATSQLVGTSAFERWSLRAGAMFGTAFDVAGAAHLVGGDEQKEVPGVLNALVERGVLRRIDDRRVAFVRSSTWQEVLRGSSPDEVRLGVKLVEAYESDHRATEPEVRWLRSTSAVCFRPQSSEGSP